MDTALTGRNPAVAPTAQELAALEKAIEDLPAGGVYLNPDLTVLPPAFDRVLSVLEPFQTRALGTMTGQTLHGIAAPGSSVRPQPVLSPAQLLRQLPGLLQLPGRTVLAVVGSPLNAHWPGSDVNPATVLGTMQAHVNQVRLTQLAGPGHKLLLGNGPRGTTNEVNYFNLNDNVEDLNKLHRNFACLDALIPAPNDRTSETPPQFVSLKHRIGQKAIQAYLRDIQGLVANRNGCAAKAAAMLDALAKTGHSPLTGDCAKAVLDCIMNNSTLAVPEDHVQDLRDALVRELDGTNGINYQNYGTFTEPLTHQEAVNKANQWVSDTGIHSSLAQYA